MTIELWKEFKRLGFVYVSYTFLRCFTAETAIVLCQLIAESNHANNKELCLGGFFLTDLNRMSKYLSITKDKIKEILTALKSKQFILMLDSGIEDVVLAALNQDSIIEYQQLKEEELMLHSWDWGLVNAQNPRGKNTTFCNSVLVLKNFVEQNIKNPENIPMVFFCYCNFRIKWFERSGMCFTDIENWQEEVLKTLNNNSFRVVDLAMCVDKLCD